MHSSILLSISSTEEDNEERLSLHVRYKVTRNERIQLNN